MSEDVCPVKLECRLEFPDKKISPYHEWRWGNNGKEKDGAILKRGSCKLCGFTLEVERFCARCGVILPKEEPRALCVECLGELKKESTTGRSHRGGGDE